MATSAYLRARGVTQCWFAYFAAPFVLPEDYGIPCRRLPTADSLSVDDDTPVPPVIDGVVLISAADLNGFEFGSSLLNPYESFRGIAPVAFVQDGVFVFEGRFAVPLASALGHVSRSKARLHAGDPQGAIREAQAAVELAPGQLQPEVALGDALAAAGQKDQALAHYKQALAPLREMTPGARATRAKTIAKKMNAVK